MQYNLLIKRTILITSFAMIPLFLPGLTLATEQKAETMSSADAQTQALPQMGVGSVLDTLRACLGRIPQDASAGQLMLGEQNCRQVDDHRTSHQDSLTF